MVALGIVPDALVDAVTANPVSPWQGIGHALVPLCSASEFGAWDGGPSDAAVEVLLLATTGLYAVGVILTLLPHGDRVTSDVAGGVVAICVGTAGIVVLWVCPVLRWRFGLDWPQRWSRRRR